MKKTTKIINGNIVTIFSGREIDLDDDLAPEYDLTNVELKPNPYAKRLREQKNKLTVQLDADIAKYFENSRAVNLFLRKHINLVQIEMNN
jgi:hypothetical protein